MSFNGPEWKNISNEAKIFIKKLLQVNPDVRYSAKQALEDQWIRIYTGADNIQITYAVALKVHNNLKYFRVRFGNLLTFFSEYSMTESFSLQSSRTWPVSLHRKKSVVK